MLRQLDSASGQALRHQVLTCLAPWMRNLTFAPRWEGAPRPARPAAAARRRCKQCARAGSWSEQLLRYLWYVTWQHGEALPAEVEALWTTAAANTRNIVPVLDYLITKCTQGEEAGSEARARARPRRAPASAAGSFGKGARTAAAAGAADAVPGGQQAHRAVPGAHVGAADGGPPGVRDRAAGARARRAAAAGGRAVRVCGRAAARAAPRQPRARRRRARPAAPRALRVQPGHRQRAPALLGFTHARPRLRGGAHARRAAAQATSGAWARCSSRRRARAPT